MKTLYEHLHNDKKYDYRKEIEICTEFDQIGKKDFRYSKNSCIAIRHFFRLAMFFLETECPENDFTLEGFIKLFHTTTYPPDGGETVFDNLIKQRIEHNPILHVLYDNFTDFAEYMPDDAYDFYLIAWDAYTGKNDIEFNPNALIKLWDILEQEVENTSTNYNLLTDESLDEYDLDDYITRLLYFFIAYEEYRKKGNDYSLTCAKEIYRNLPEDTDEKHKVKICLNNLLYDTIEYGILLRVMDRNYTKN